jgi:hypothetical protein
MTETRKLIDPVDREYRRKRLRRLAFLGIFAYLVAALVYWSVFAEVPVDYGNLEDHFLYGSIGSDSEGGLPYWIWYVLPEMFPEHLPNPTAFADLAADERTGLAGYAQFGYVLEKGRNRPIGFSMRRDLVDRVGLNCAVCHTSTVRITEGMDPDVVYGKKPRFAAGGQQVIVPGMPANTLDLQAYFQFLFDCAQDGRFTTENVMAHIDGRTEVWPKERFFYKRAVPEVRSMLLKRRRQVSYFSEEPAKVPQFGPGRVDTFTPYKTMVFGFPYDGTVGTADFPSLWNQRPREGMHLHWDGNNQSVFERNISASLGAGATPVTLDIPRMLRVARWIGSPEPDPDKQFTDEVVRAARAQTEPRRGELKIPKYPFPVDAGLAEVGRVIYRQQCAECHDWDGKKIGEVVPIDAIGTDRFRLDSYTRELSANQNTLGADHWWRFRNFRKTDGYSNMPLDGLWARAPYLHNGSVPTLRDLLKEPERRPKWFYRGNDEYDPANVGFVSPVPEATGGQAPARMTAENGRILFLFDTSRDGNGNGGHQYGTDLGDEQCAALLEYLKTL